VYGYVRYTTERGQTLWSGKEEGGRRKEEGGRRKEEG